MMMLSKRSIALPLLTVGIALSVTSTSTTGIGSLLGLSRAYSDDTKVSFSPKEFTAFPIQRIVKLNYNTKKYIVALPSAEHEMGMPTASCIMVKGCNDKDGKQQARPYTPTTGNEVKGHFELVVKSYPDGNVSKYLDSLKEGDLIEVKGMTYDCILIYSSNTHSYKQTKT